MCCFVLQRKGIYVSGVDLTYNEIDAFVTLETFSKLRKSLELRESLLDKTKSDSLFIKVIDKTLSEEQYLIREDGVICMKF